MQIDTELIEFLVLRYGLLGFLFVVLVLIILDPDRAEKLKALIILPIYRLCKYGSRAYLASEIGYQTTVFFKHHLLQFIPSLPNVKVKIKWVTSPSDPVLSEDGTLVLRIQETNDQARNILAATRVALPRILCTTLRPYLEEYASSAIDLTVLRKLADKLGRHAHPIFQRYFLAPEVEEDVRAAELFAKLLIIDRTGIFVSIFLEELNALGSVLYSTGETRNVTDEITSFLEFLLLLANRDLGQEIQLEFHSENINVGLLLLAISFRAATEGTAPYIRRIDRYLTLGYDSIYIVAYPPARDFVPRILGVIEGDFRITVVKTNSFSIERRSDLGYETGISKVVLLRRNTIFGDSTFGDKLSALEISENSQIKGTVLDVSQDKALVDIGGITGTISRTECSWGIVFDCRDYLKKNESYEFMVSLLDKDAHKLELTCRFPESDPWNSNHLPKEGDEITVKVFAIKGDNYICSYVDNIELLLPMHELSWLSRKPDDPKSIIDTKQNVGVFDMNKQDHILLCSIRRLSENPWPDIHKRYPKGTDLHGKVIEVTEHFVRIQLPEDIIGIVPKEAMERAGFEYADYRNNVVPGQGLDVVVTKVFLRKRQIRLDLKRNITGQNQN